MALKKLYLEPLLFLIYLNDILKITNNKSKIVLFTDDTSIIIINPKPQAFINAFNKALKVKNDA